MTLAGRPNYAREIRNALTDPRSLCEKLGLLAERGSFERQTGGGMTVRCPWHTEKSPSCSVTRGPDGTLRARCFGCDASGDALSLIAEVRGLSVTTEFRAVLVEAATLAGLHAIVVELETGHEDAQRRPVVAPMARPEAEREYLGAAELSAFWEACRPASEAVDVSAWIQSRGVDPERVDVSLARALPVGSLPRWAAYQRRPRSETGHRLVFPTFDASGAMRSVRVGRVIDGDTPKRLPPAGVKAAGLVLACSLAVAMFTGTFAPGRILFVEGEPDFLVGATWRMRTPTACIGLVSGGWTAAFAPRVPIGCEVLLFTDRDRAGDKYAEQVVQSLQRSRGCRISRWVPKESAT